MKAAAPRDPARAVLRFKLVHFATLAATATALHVIGCNSLLENEERSLDNDVRVDAGRSTKDGAVDSSPLQRVEADASADARVTDAATPDADAGPRMPDPACLKASGMVSPNAVLRVEKDATPAPIVTATTVTLSFTIVGNNGMSGVRLDLCTPDGLTANAGGGTTFLGGGGAVARRWQTNSATLVPIGKVQAQVYSDDPPVLRYLANLDVF